MATKPNYEILFQEAIYHLRALYGSRNSFTPEVNDIHMSREKGIDLRTPEVASMHSKAGDFLRKYDK